SGSGPRFGESPSMRISTRAQRIEPFYVMEVAKAAGVLAREVAHTDQPMIFLNIGEPDFTAPPLVQEAAARAVRAGAPQYTQATGLAPVGARGGAGYRRRSSAGGRARRFVARAGASAVLRRACRALIEGGEETLMPAPSFP